MADESSQAVQKSDLSGIRGDTRPVPDPTALTTEQLTRAIANLEALFLAKIDGIIGIRDEKFSLVELQFRLVEQQRLEQKQDTKAAVDAALTAQKEAVKEQTTASERAIAKSEASTSKQLEQLTATFTTAIAGVGNSLSDLKDRINSIESIKVGARENVQQHQQTSIVSIALGSFVVSMILAAIVVVGVIAAIK